MTDLQTGSYIIVSLIIGYIISAQPDLSQYALQVFAAAAFAFFILKRVKRAKIWHILPESNSIEMAIVSLAIFVLIANTGNLSSPFFPIGFIHLFFLVLTTSPKVSVATTSFLVYLHYLLTPNIALIDVANLSTLPLLLFCFLFAKAQYDEAQRERQTILEQQKSLQEVTDKEHTLESFIFQFLLPKLDTMRQLIEKNVTDKDLLDPQVLKTQITILASESEKIVMKSKLSENTEVDPEK